MLKTKLVSDLKSAISEKDTIRKDTIQLIRASILQFEKDNQTVVDDNKIIEIIASELKKRKDALEQFQKANREDLVDQTNYEIEIINKYLPAQLTDEELEAEALNVIKEVNAKSVKDLGLVMKTAKAKFGNRVDGKRISDAARKLLSEIQEDGK